MNTHANDPVAATQIAGSETIWPGLTKLELFALVAMHGIIVADPEKKIPPIRATEDAMRFAKSLIHDLNSQ